MAHVELVTFTCRGMTDARQPHVLTCQEVQDTHHTVGWWRRSGHVYPLSGSIDVVFVQAYPNSNISDLHSEYTETLTLPSGLGGGCAMSRQGSVYDPTTGAFQGEMHDMYRTLRDEHPVYVAPDGTLRPVPLRGRLERRARPGGVLVRRVAEAAQLSRR